MSQLSFLFDLDGTLTDPKEGITKCVIFALETVGLTAPSAEELEVGRYSSFCRRIFADVCRASYGVSAVLHRPSAARLSAAADTERREEGGGCSSAVSEAVCREGHVRKRGL